MTTIRFPVSEETIDDIKENARQWEVGKDTIMRAAINQVLHDGLNPHFFDVLRTNGTTDRILVRLDDGAYDEVTRLADGLKMSRAVYAAACILQSLSRGLVGSFVDDATYDLGRPVEAEDDKDPLWGKRQAELWGIWREWQWANGDEEADAEMLLHA